jgi:glycosyltransferase involved in cell wall biosynthesis
MTAIPGNSGCDSTERLGERRRILAVATVDVTPWVLLKPWFQALRASNYEVHIACAPGPYCERLAAEGFQMHAVSLRRSFNPFVHIRPLFQLYRLVRQGGYAVVNTHTPVAAAVGRVAAWLAGCKNIVYTVHGFYFHENMFWLWRRLFVALEWLLGRCTVLFMFVSDEDRRTAIQTGIARPTAEAVTIYNGIDLSVFSPRSSRLDAIEDDRQQLGIPEGNRVVGIVGRIVREKGYREFLEMAKELSRRHDDVRFLVVGDSLPSDRDSYGPVLRRRVREEGLDGRFLLTGFTSEVPKYLRMMDIFVLPSYREGFPRSVLEAMATELPVVATNIRGCREAVVHGETGFIVPPKDAKALTEAVDFLLGNPDKAKDMGRAGRERAVKLYDQRMVADRFVAAFDRLLKRSVPRKEAIAACD